jgi:hypothetical protein
MIHNSGNIHELAQLRDQMRSEAGDASRHKNQDALRGKHSSISWNEAQERQKQMAWYEMQMVR